MVKAADTSPSINTPVMQSIEIGDGVCAVAGARRKRDGARARRRRFPNGLASFGLASLSLFPEQGSRSVSCVGPGELGLCSSELAAPFPRPMLPVPGGFQMEI